MLTLDRWLSFRHAIQQHSPELIPITCQKIRAYAEKDIEFLKRIQTLDREARFNWFKEYLIHQVIPEYCTDVERVSTCLVGKNDFDELRDVLARIFIESLLCLTYAEAEYLLGYCTNQNSVLSRCIPALHDEPIAGPSKIFFRLWMDALSLSRKAVVSEMVDHFGESGVAEEDIEPDGSEGLSKDAIEKQLQRYLNEGRCPSWKMVEKWSQGL